MKIAYLLESMFVSQMGHPVIFLIVQIQHNDVFIPKRRHNYIANGAK